MDVSTTIVPDETGALASLERFVIENDDLLELEAHVGKFNIFDELRIEKVEICHSNFLAWLLDPRNHMGKEHCSLKRY
jgi:hypothetical protein